MTIKHQLKTITVGELIDRLQKAPDHTPVRVWLPGTRIALGSVTIPAIGDQVLIEGNIEPGSVLHGDFRGAA